MADSRCPRGAFELTNIGSTLLVGAVILSLLSKCSLERRVVDIGAAPMIDEDLSWRMDNVTPSRECVSYDQNDFISSWALDVGLLHNPSTRSETPRWVLAPDFALHVLDWIFQL